MENETILLGDDVYARVEGETVVLLAGEAKIVLSANAAHALMDVIAIYLPEPLFLGNDEGSWRDQ